MEDRHINQWNRTEFRNRAIYIVNLVFSNTAMVIQRWKITFSTWCQNNRYPEKRKKEPQSELLTQKLTQNRSQPKTKNWNYKISRESYKISTISIQYGFSYNKWSHATHECAQVSPHHEFPMTLKCHY